MRAIFLVLTLVLISPGILFSEQDLEKKELSLDLVDLDIATVIRIFSENLDKNIVLHKDVTGPVTIRLTDVPAGTAFNAILSMKNAYRVEKDDVIHVLPIGVEPK